MSGRVHVVGSGLSGLAAAVAIARAGRPVTLHEAAGHAGGRCRSFLDRNLDRLIDNGTHLVLGVNRTVLGYVRAIGGLEAMDPGPPVFPFVDLASGDRWKLSTGSLLRHPLELLKACGLPAPTDTETVAERLGHHHQFARIWEPLCVAALNTSAEESSAEMFARLLRAVALGGRSALVPWIFPAGLSSALVAPALATLASHGAQLRFRHRLAEVSEGALQFDDGAVGLSSKDRVILALPPWTLGEIMDNVPRMESRAIVNAHFRLEQPLTLPGGLPYLGVTGGFSQWLALRGDVLSVTVSAADQLAGIPGETVADLLWREVANIVGLAVESRPEARVIKEKRATIAHTPAGVQRRPSPLTAFPNIYLAGDWMAGPWPCTIEAAVSSGLSAARMALDNPALTFAS